MAQGNRFKRLVEEGTDYGVFHNEPGCGGFQTGNPHIYADEL